MGHRSHRRKRLSRRLRRRRGLARHYHQGGYQRRLFPEQLEDRRMLAGVHPFDLATLDGSNGFRLDGIDEDDYSGWLVSTAGDVNGDGYDDILVGAYGADPGGDNMGGETYVVFGSGSGFAASLDLSTLDGSNGFRLDQALMRMIAPAVRSVRPATSTATATPTSWWGPMVATRVVTATPARPTWSLAAGAGLRPA